MTRCYILSHISSPPYSITLSYTFLHMHTNMYHGHRCVHADMCCQLNLNKLNILSCLFNFKILVVSKHFLCFKQIDNHQEQACQMAFTLLTTVYQLPLDCLYFTYFGGNSEQNLSKDTECRDIWRSLGWECTRVAFASDSLCQCLLLCSFEIGKVWSNSNHSTVQWKWNLL